MKESLFIAHTRLYTKKRNANAFGDKTKIRHLITSVAWIRLILL